MPKDKYYYAKKLKALVKAERNLERSKYKLIKKINKCENIMVRLHNSMFSYYEKLQAAQKLLEEAVKYNGELKQFISKQNEPLPKLKINIAAKKEQQKRQQIEELEAREQKLAQMDKLHCLEEMSKVYVNYKQLPTRIKGLTLCEKCDNTKWHPFEIDPMQYTQEEVQAHIWQMTQDDQMHQPEWEALFFIPAETEPECVPEAANEVEVVTENEIDENQAAEPE